MPNIGCPRVRQKRRRHRGCTRRHKDPAIGAPGGETIRADGHGAGARRGRGGGARGEVPVGAALLDAEGKMVAADGNRTEELADPTAHAEMLVIRAAA